MKRLVLATLLAPSLLACPAKPDEAKTAAPVEAKKEPPKPTAPAGPDRAALQETAKTLFGSLQPGRAAEDAAVEAALVELGRILYYEKRLSIAQDQSCNTCHDLAQYGIDPRETDGKRNATSLGHKGQFGGRNAPTVYNAFVHAAQFWDGRAKDVEEQAKGPILNPVEMGMPDEKTVLRVLTSIPGYADKFAAAFPGEKNPINYDNMAKAIGAFERKLVTPAPIDDFLAGKTDALTDEQVEGLDLYVKKGCVACHMGPAFGGSLFQKLGLIKPWPTGDLGRYEVTKNEADKHFFKVPSLRNIEKTGPYLHDGSIASLEEIVKKMAEHQTPGGALSDAETAKIVAFLSSLTGTIDQDYIKEPQALAAGPKTPKPKAD